MYVIFYKDDEMDEVFIGYVSTEEKAIDFCKKMNEKYAVEEVSAYFYEEAKELDINNYL